MHETTGAVPRELLWSAVSRWEAVVRMRREQFERLRGVVRPPDDDAYWRRRVAGYYAAVRARDDDGHLVRAALAELDAAGGADAALLDVGGGFGAVAVPVARRGHPVTVVEPSEAMRAYLETWADEEGVRDRIAIVPQGWLEAAVAPHDVVLCSHVLYPISDVAAFVRRLVGASRHACLIALRVAANETVPASMFAELHGEERVPQPTFGDLCAVLGELGIPYEATPWTSRTTWSWASLDEAEESMSETLLVADDPRARGRIRAWAAEALVRDEGGYRLPEGTVREGLAIVRADR